MTRKISRYFTAVAMLLAAVPSKAQQPFNMIITNAEADAVLKGNYDPSDYLTGTDILPVDDIICTINADVSPDSLKHYLEVMSTFYTRHTYSDTLSTTTGIGAARKWAVQKFHSFSSRVEGRLLPSYLQFEMPANAECGAGRFKNIIAVLPGTQTDDGSIVIIEAHLDSRCAGDCDTACFAAGMEDNGSGSALVIELARVMSRFAFDHTIVFMLTVGEEQGLYGGEAMADYCQQHAIPVRAVQNNDIVGGIYCGETSSPPSCTFQGHVDSTHVRIFSSGSANSKHKSYARYVKMMYEEKLVPIVEVPMEIMIMNPEDRTGRGGDHIPFRENGFTAIRFTSANEHGDGSVHDTAYHDRQHTSHDILGVDTDGDSVLDSFFVSFTYLARNAVINGASAAMCAFAPETPADFIVTATGSDVTVTIDDSMHYNHYRVGARSSAHDFDAVYSVADTNVLSIPGLLSGTLYRISVASVNEDGVMSLFSQEKNVTPSVNSVGFADTVQYAALHCTILSNEEPTTVISSGVKMKVQPNPAAGKAVVVVELQEALHAGNSYIEIHDLNAALVLQLKVNLQRGVNSFEFDLGSLPAGTYECVLRKSNTILQQSKLAILR